MSDKRTLVERLRDPARGGGSDSVEAAAEIERLQELLRGIGANRYWEGRWRDAEAEIERLKEQVAKLQASSGYEASIAQLEIERLRADIATWKAMWEAGDGHGGVEAAPTKDQG